MQRNIGTAQPRPRPRPPVTGTNLEGLHVVVEALWDGPAEEGAPPGPSM